MAMLLGLQADEELRQGLSPLAGGDANRVAVRTLALGGWKQPQQLHLLAALLVSGESPDLVINLDGLNEIFLSWAENHQRGVPEEFPRAWDALAAGLTDSEGLERAGWVAFLSRSRRTVAERIDRAPWRWSFSAGLVERAFQAVVGQKEHSARQALSVVPIGKGPFPTESDQPTTVQESLRRSVELWGRASEGMDAICRAAGCRYFHFLQPNLHDPLGKHLTAEEEALREAGGPVGPLVQAGYPMLVRRLAALEESGVAAFDLTRAFSTQRSSLWVDTCCHVSAEGSKLLAAEIGKAIVAGTPRADVRTTGSSP